MDLPFNTARSQPKNRKSTDRHTTDVNDNAQHILGQQQQQQHKECLLTALYKVLFMYLAR